MRCSETCLTDSEVQHLQNVNLIDYVLKVVIAATYLIGAHLAEMAGAWYGVRPINADSWSTKHMAGISRDGTRRWQSAQVATDVAARCMIAPDIVGNGWTAAVLINLVMLKALKNGCVSLMSQVKQLCCSIVWSDGHLPNGEHGSYSRQLRAPGAVKGEEKNHGENVKEYDQTIELDGVMHDNDDKNQGDYQYHLGNGSVLGGHYGIPDVWHVARQIMNKLMHAMHGNGGPTVSTTLEWASDDSQGRQEGILSPPTSPTPTRIRRWGPGRRVHWMPLGINEDYPLAQPWPIVIEADMCGELIEIHTIQTMTVGEILERASDALMVHAKDLVVVEAGDIISRATSASQLSWIDINFSIDGGVGASVGPMGRSRSRTPARRIPSTPQNVALIQPDATAVEMVDDKPHYLVVVHTLPKGRKYYPLYFPLDATLADVRWEYGRVARRGVGTFTMWQGNYRYRDKDLVSIIDRTKYVDIWKTEALDNQGDEEQGVDEMQDISDEELARGLAKSLEQGPGGCPDCQRLEVRVARLEGQIDFLEELLEAPPQLRLRGGGRRRSKPPDKADGPELPEAYEAVLLRSYKLCQQYTKAQLRTLLRSDPPLCARLQKVDDPSLIRIIVAAGKRNGMTPGAAVKSPHDEMQNMKGDAAKEKEDKGGSRMGLSLGELDDAADETMSVLSLLSTFDVPTVTSLRPGEDGVLLGEGQECVSKMLTRFAGSAGSAALITPAVEPVEMVLQFRKTHKDEPAMDYTAMAYLYRLTASTPKLVKETPVVSIQPKRRSSVLGMEVLKTRDTTDLCTAIQQDKPDYATVRKHLMAILQDEQASAGVLECFMAKTTTSSFRCLVRVAASARDIVLKASGDKAVFWSPELDKKDQYVIFWLPANEAEDYREALRAAGKVESYGVVTRLDQTGARRYGIRVKVGDKEKAASTLGRPTGDRYYIKNAPIEWIAQDILDFAKQVKWEVTIPNQQTAMRIRKGTATWTVRATAAPAMRSAVVQTGDERITLMIEPATEKKPQQRQQSAPPARSWATIVATSAVKTVNPKMPVDNAKKRKTATAVRATTEPPVDKTKPKVVSFEQEPVKEVPTKGADPTQLMFATIMAQMKDMQRQMAGIGREDRMCRGIGARFHAQ